MVGSRAATELWWASMKISSDLSSHLLHQHSTALLLYLLSRQVQLLKHRHGWFHNNELLHDYEQHAAVVAHRFTNSI